MKSVADGLPPEIAQLIHADWRKNEADYWAQRDQLLPQYRDQWVAFANERVIAASRSSVEIVHLAQESGQHPFVTCVGHEHEPFRIRRATFPYEAAYPGPPLPILTLEFRKQHGSPGPLFDRVIADTGADASTLPWADCQQVGLAPAGAPPALMSGVGTSKMVTILLAAWAYLYWAWSRLILSHSPQR